MPEELDYIERYFEGKFSAGELLAFEKRIVEDSSFAEEFAFYVSAMQAARQKANEEKTIRFREIYNNTKATIPIVHGRFRRLLPYISAAAVIAGIVVCLFVFYPSPSPDKLADKYLQEHLQNLSVIMDTKQNNFKTAVRLYNEGKLAEALMHFEIVLRTDSGNIRAMENAGIASLRLKQYDKALQYFGELENYPGLYANPGKFYHALTLMKRNLPGDSAEAKKLLQEVADNHLDMDNYAKELLKKL